MIGRRRHDRADGAGRRPRARRIAVMAAALTAALLALPWPAAAQNEITFSLRNCSGQPINVGVFNATDSGRAFPASGWDSQAHGQTVGFKCYRTMPGFDQTYCQVEVKVESTKAIYRVESNENACFTYLVPGPFMQNYRPCNC